MQSTQTVSLDSCKCPCLFLFDCCFNPAIPFRNSTGKTNKDPRKETLHIIVLHLVTLFECLGFFSVRLTVSEFFKSFWDCPGVVSTTCCHCDIIRCICDIILCDSSFESFVFCLFMFMISASATCSFNCLTIVHSHL